MNRKQRIVHGEGASNITYSPIVFNFDGCRVSLPVSTTNYALTDLHVAFLQPPLPPGKIGEGAPSPKADSATERERQLATARPK